jgi:CRP-like cAMP-binding protein
VINRPVFTQIHLFKDLSPAALQKLEAAASVRSYPDSALILQEGEEGEAVFFVLEGTVRVFRTNLDGREQTLIQLPPGAVFNLPAAFTKERLAPASVLATGPVQVLSIPLDDFRRIAAEVPEVALALLEDLSTRLHHFTGLAHDLSLRSVRGRLAKFLLERFHTEGAGPYRFTHEEVASQIGTVREVVSRTLRAFAQEGLIRIERHRIILADINELQDIADS